MNIEQDHKGYLKNPADWSETVAVALAAQDNLMLTDAHWEVIHFLREHYQKYANIPGVRALVMVIRNSLGAEKGNSIYLHQLFPKGPAMQASKIAGLPKPIWCV